MRISKKFLTGAIAAMILSPVVSKAADASFKAMGWAEAGYLFQKVDKGPSVKKASFFLKEVVLGGQAKLDDHELNVALNNGSAFNSNFYRDAILAAPGAGTVGVLWANIVLKPHFLKGGTWTWGVYRSPFGWEQDNPTVRLFRSNTDASFIYPAYLTGTNVHFDFGMVWAELHLVSTLGASGWTVDGTRFPAIIGTFGAGSNETFWAKFSYGFSKKGATAGALPKNGHIIDFSAGAFLMDALTFAAEFYFQKNQANAATLKNWTFNLLVDYMFTSTLGAGMRFDYNKNKDIGLAFGAHYMIAKNLKANLEYNLGMKKLPASTTVFDASGTAIKSTDSNVSYSIAYSF